MSESDSWHILSPAQAAEGPSHCFQLLSMCFIGPGGVDFSFSFFHVALKTDSWNALLGILKHSHKPLRLG